MLFVSHPKISYIASAACALLGLAGCSSGRVIPSVGPQTVSVHMQGRLRGGQQPVNGATIQLFDISAAQVGVTGAQPLLTSTVLSDASGAFNITGDYTCPTLGDQVYLAATGGDSGSGFNGDLVMMTALGNCGDLTPQTFISVNEVTTAATIFSYYNQFDTSQTGGANIVIFNGSTEYQNFLSLVDPTTGVALATNGVDVQLELNALGNTLSTCVNSSTDSNGHSAACDTLVAMANDGSFNLASNDSAQAMFLMAASPSYNPSGEYNYAPPSPPFQPTLSAAPPVWDLHLPH